MIILFAIAFIFLGLLLVTLLINALSGPFLRKGRLEQDGPLVSLLIPARNEAHNIAECLKGLGQQTYKNLEILVLDDQSEDGTAAIVREMQKLDGRIRLVTGKPLPKGWTGKNWACHQLAQMAKGQFLLFTDADNRHHPDAVARTVGSMQTYHLDGFSAFPQQFTVTFFEKLVIPFIDLIVYSMLPLWLTRYSKHPSLSAANGQWLAFSRQAYKKIGGHAAVAHEIVEDVSLSRLLKKKGYHMLTVAGTDMVWARMYRSAGEVWEGLSKNLFGLVGNSLPLFVIIGVLFLWTMVAPYGLIMVPGLRLMAGILIGLNLLIRTVLSFRFRHPFFISLLLHPFSVLLILAIGVNSVRLTRTGKVIWKGRRISRHAGAHSLPRVQETAHTSYRRVGR